MGKTLGVKSVITKNEDLNEGKVSIYARPTLSEAIESKEVEKKVGTTSRCRGAIISTAIKRCDEKDRHNVKMILPHVTDILLEKYYYKCGLNEIVDKYGEEDPDLSDKSLVYQSTRMGLDSTDKIIREIEEYLKK